MKEKIDVLIPCHEKDVDTLPYCIEGINKFVEDDINGIFVIGPSRKSLKDVCNSNNVTFVDEYEYMGFAPKDLTRIQEDRRGWLFQQLIKLKGKPGLCDNYLSMDADLLLLKPHHFLTQAKIPVFYKQKKPSYKEYYEVAANLLGKKHEFEGSYVSEKMLFNDNYIKELHNEICKNCDTEDWVDAIVSNYNNNVIFGFSEFELYGSFMQDKEHKDILCKQTYFAKPMIKYVLKNPNKFKEFDSITFF